MGRANFTVGGIQGLICARYNGRWSACLFQLVVRLLAPWASMLQFIAQRYGLVVAAGTLASFRLQPAPHSTLVRNYMIRIGIIGCGRILAAHLRGECELDEAVEDAVAATRRLARRQERWFRRDPRITWFDVADDPMAVLDDLLATFDACAP